MSTVVLPVPFVQRDVYRGSQEDWGGTYAHYNWLVSQARIRKRW